MNTDNRNPKKKRKVDGGRADGRRNDTSLPQLDRMEQMMMRMEDKLGTISSLESRCEELERKCSSLENKMDSTMQLVKDHTDQKFELKCTSLENKLESTLQSVKDVDRKLDSLHNNIHEKSSLMDDKIEVMNKKTQAYHDYNSMLVKNQSWKYSAAIPAIEQIMSDTDCDYHTAVNLTKEIQEMKEKTIKMRRGEFSSSEMNNWKCIWLNTLFARDQIFYSVSRPHVEEFAAALEQFTPAMNVLLDEVETTDFSCNAMMDHDGQMMIKKALIGKPFASMDFCSHNNVHGGYGGMTANDIVTIAESNKYLQRLQMTQNSIHDDITNRLCSVVHNHSLLELYLYRSIHDAGVGNAILANLFTNVELKLESLSITSAGITSDVSTVLADFIAANPVLQYLNLESNSLEDSDAALIASALRSNTTLSSLSLNDNNITKNGFELFRPVLCDESSLNAVADSNHTCRICEFDWEVNCKNEIAVNRGRKIFTLLSSRHKEMSNVQYFSEVDVNLLPNMLEAVKRYAKTMEEEDEEEDGSDFEAPNPKARSLSIVHEIMRRWEKVFNLYEG